MQSPQVSGVCSPKVMSWGPELDTPELNRTDHRMHDGAGPSLASETNGANSFDETRRQHSGLLVVVHPTEPKCD
jgi:hypothetical protein